MNIEKPFREYLTPGMTLDQVIAYCKKNPDLVKRTLLGRAVLKAIKRGDSKWLWRYWSGSSWLSGKPVGAP